MTETVEKNSGTTSELSTSADDGSKGLDLRGLLKRERFNGTEQLEVAEDGALRQRDDDADLPALRGEDPATGGDQGKPEAGRRGLEATAEAILNALDPDAANASEGEGEAGEGEEGEKPRGVKRGQQTLAAFAEDLDLDASKLYTELMIPLNDGTGRHVSLEKLRAGYMGTDADQVSQDRAEHEQRLAAFEVDKSEHETRVVRDRKEVSQMLSLMQAHLPPQAVEQARVAARRQLAESAAAMLERFPAWRDPTVAAAWTSKAVECLKQYGFGGSDVSSITDARLCSLVDNHMKLLDWAAKVRNPETVPKRPTKAAKQTQRGSPGKGSRRRGIIDAAKQKGASREDKIAGIVALLAESAPGK